MWCGAAAARTCASADDGDDDDHHHHHCHCHNHHQPWRSPPLLAAHCNECLVFCRQRLEKLLLIALSLDLRSSFPQYAATHRTVQTRLAKIRNRASKLTSALMDLPTVPFIKTTLKKSNLKYIMVKRNCPQNCLYGIVIASYIYWKQIPFAIFWSKLGLFRQLTSPAESMQKKASFFAAATCPQQQQHLAAAA